MNTWLVTGGAGFIGANFVRSSLGRCCERLVNLDLLTYAACPQTVAALDGLPGYTLVRGDIADRALVETLLARHRPEIVFHFAAESHVDRSIDRPADFIATNVAGTSVLLDAVLSYWRALPEAERRAFRYVQISTDEVFGSIAEGRFTEDSPFRPNSPYAASKAAADHLARAWHHTYGLPAIVTHCSNNYGPFQFPEKLIPLMILKGLAGEALPLYGDGRQVRDWLYVADHVQALHAIAGRASPGAVYLIGGDGERTNRQVVEMICDLIDRRRPPAGGRPRRDSMVQVEDRLGHDRRYAIDAARLKRELGWAPAVDFATGLAATVDWYLEHPEWIEAARTSYRGERLGVALAS